MKLCVESSWRYQSVRQRITRSAVEEAAARKMDAQLER